MSIGLTLPQANAREPMKSPLATVIGYPAGERFSEMATTALAMPSFCGSCVRVWSGGAGRGSRRTGWVPWWGVSCCGAAPAGCGGSGDGPVGAVVVKAEAGESCEVDGGSAHSVL